jgi:hypothetical protein
MSATVSLNRKKECWPWATHGLTPHDKRGPRPEWIPDHVIEAILCLPGHASGGRYDIKRTTEGFRVSSRNEKRLILSLPA